MPNISHALNGIKTPVSFLSRGDRWNLKKTPQDTPNENMQVSRIEEEREIIVNIIPRGDWRSRICVYCRRVGDGWVSRIQWSAGDEDARNPGNCTAWIEAMSAAVSIYDELRASHPLSRDVSDK